MSKLQKKIVWIEDDTAIIDPVVRPLERTGYQIVRLGSAEAALNNIAQIQNANQRGKMKTSHEMQKYIFH